jgi:hypothetical protein
MAVNVRFGSKADIGSALVDVGFTPQKRTLLSVTGMSAKCPIADIGDPHFVYCSSVTFSNQSTGLPSSLS